MFFSTVLLLSLVCADKPDVADHLQNVSVTIKAGSSSGSGVVKTRKDKDGNLVNFVWTAGHVVDGLKSTREVIAPDGSRRTLVEFKDPAVVKDFIEDGRTIGFLQLDAEVIRYSDANTGEDLALLKLRKKNYIKDSASFFLDVNKDKTPVIPKIGTQLFHVGSLLGQSGSNSMTTGIVSQVGRIIPELNKVVFDQTTVTAFPGSSGGGVFLTDGRYMGMLVRGAGETFNLVVPIRRMQEWAKKTKCEWAIDDNVPLPADEDIRKSPIEDSGLNFIQKLINGGDKKSKHPYLIGTTKKEIGVETLQPRVHSR